MVRQSWLAMWTPMYFPIKAFKGGYGWFFSSLHVSLWRACAFHSKWQFSVRFEGPWVWTDTQKTDEVFCINCFPYPHCHCFAMLGYPAVGTCWKHWFWFALVPTVHRPWLSQLFRKPVITVGILRGLIDPHYHTHSAIQVIQTRLISLQRSQWLYFYTTVLLGAAGLRIPAEMPTPTFSWPSCSLEGIRFQIRMFPTGSWKIPREDSRADVFSMSPTLRCHDVNRW